MRFNATTARGAVTFITCGGITCGICGSVCDAGAVGVWFGAQEATNEDAASAPLSFRKSRRDIFERIGEAMVSP
jgi:hypothetical protein